MYQQRVLPQTSLNEYTNMRVNKYQPAVAIVQARMASSRLPGKVLLPIAGQAMLTWVVNRTRQAKSVDAVVVATSTDPADDAIAELCKETGVPCSRGSQFDVLDRCTQAAREMGAGIVVRITADCPLIDPGLINQTVQALWGTDPGNRDNQRTQYDFSANRLPPPWVRSYPIGLDVEACTFEALEIAWKEAGETHQREHVMPFLYENPDRFRIIVLDNEEDFGTLRWTVDTPEDLETVRALFSHLPPDFNWLDVLQVWHSHPEIAVINASVTHKSARDVDDRQG